MDAVLLTWRWQNILSIGLIIVGWALLFTIIGQITLKANGGANAS